MLTGTTRPHRFERPYARTSPRPHRPAAPRPPALPRDTRAIMEMLSVLNMIDPDLRRAVEAAAPSARRSYVLGTMACAAGQLAEAEHRLSQALAQAETETGSGPLTALIARELAGVSALAADEKKATALGRLALTPRETEVAHLIGKGLSNPEIAAELFISRKAVEFHLSNVYAKCGLQGRQQLRRFVAEWPLPDSA